jgi:hypothetical protein
MQDAQTASVLVILPVLALVVSQATGLLLFNTSVALAASGAPLVLDVVIFLAVVGRFRRERIVTLL